MIEDDDDGDIRDITTQYYTSPYANKGPLRLVKATNSTDSCKI